MERSRGASSSAAQPAQLVEAPYHYPSSVSAVQPEKQSPTEIVGFYNVGWNSSSMKHNAHCLADEVYTITTSKNLADLGFSEVYNIKEDGLKKQQLCLEKETVDVHYIFIWNSEILGLLRYEVVSCGIEEHPERRARYLELYKKDTIAALHNLLHGLSLVLKNLKHCLCGQCRRGLRLDPKTPRKT